jgi:anaerobic magnesium-protoporphyrin IX monomethyl ester cyclase
VRRIIYGYGKISFSVLIYQSIPLIDTMKAMQKQNILLVAPDSAELYSMNTELFPLWVQKHLLESNSTNGLIEFIQSENLSYALNLLGLSGKYIQPSDNLDGRSHASIGLLTIAACLQKANWHVDLYDFALNNSTLDGFGKLLLANKPLIVGISAMTPLIPQAYRICNYVKDILPDCKVMIGGHHVTFCDEVTLAECESIDYVVRGEGEITCVEVADSVLNKQGLHSVLGLTYRDKFGQIKRNDDRPLHQDIDDFPLPAFDLLKANHKYVYNFSMSRGCPCYCSFCSDSSLWQNRVRFRSPKMVVEEINSVLAKHPSIELMCSDSNFLISMDRVMILLDLLPDKFFKNHFSSMLIRVDHIDIDRLAAIERLGFRELYVGCENSSNRILEDMNKGISFNDTIKSLQLVRTQIPNLSITALWVVGFPTENEESVKHNLSSIRKLFSQDLVNDIDPCFFVPHPGTQVWKNPEDFGVEMLHSSWRDYDFHQKPVYNSQTLRDPWAYYLKVYQTTIESMMQLLLPKELHNEFLSVSNILSNELTTQMQKQLTNKGI